MTRVLQESRTDQACRKHPSMTLTQVTEGAESYCYCTLCETEEVCALEERLRGPWKDRLYEARYGRRRDVRRVNVPVGPSPPAR